MSTDSFAQPVENDRETAIPAQVADSQLQDDHPKGPETLQGKEQQGQGRFNPRFQLFLRREPATTVENPLHRKFRRITCRQNLSLMQGHVIGMQVCRPGASGFRGRRRGARQRDASPGC